MKESAGRIYRPDLICATILTEEQFKKEIAQISGREENSFFHFCLDF